MTEQERYDLGMKKRREILGDAHVDRALSVQTPETQEFQALITRYAWGEIWTRPGIDPTTRRLLVLVMMIARGHDEEFEMHLRAALRAGVAREQIVEAILQCAIYCGVPSANRAFAQARAIFAEFDEADR